MATNNYSISFTLTFFLLFFIFLYLFFTFVKDGKLQWQSWDWLWSFNENFETSDEMKTKVAKLSSQIEKKNEPTKFVSFLSTDKNRPELKFKELCIKGSIHSAYDGKQMNPLMIEYVLHRGCRFLHFDIYFERDDSQLFIGFGEKKEKIPTDNGNDNLEFEDAIAKTIDFAFVEDASSKYKTTNIDDPLFILLRLRIFKEDQETVCKILAKKMSRIIKQYKKHYRPIPLKGNTKISKYLGNKSLFFLFDNDDGIDPFNLAKIEPFFNCQLSPPNNNIRKLFYYHINKNEYKPSIANSKKDFVLIVPNLQKGKLVSQTNPDIYIATEDYQFNCVMCQYWNQDINYKKMEYYFGDALNGGIVDLNSAQSTILNN